MKEDPTAVAHAAAERIGALINGSSERFTLGLAGGSTPSATYGVMRSSDIDWANVDAWLSDERWVPHEHARSNGRMALEELIDHVDARFHRPGWGHDPDEAAADYEEHLKSLHDDARPDVIMLGIGPDGHTASLFPGSSVLEERDRLYVSTYVPQMEETRLTATYPLLWGAKLIVVVTCGSSKAEAVAACFAGDKPAGLLGEGEAEVEWYVDEDAASLLV